MRNAKALAQFFSAMSAVNRFSQYRLVNPESILEHTAVVAITTMSLVKMIGPHIDMAACLEKALCHDMDEILTGDIPMPTKYATEEIRDAINNVADINMKIIDFDYGTAFYGAWSRESRIVKLADVIAVYYKAYQEVELFGNKSLIPAIQYLDTGLSKALDAFEDAFGEHTKIKNLVNEMIKWAEDTK